MKVLRQIWAGWKRVGQLMANTVGRVLLTVFHFTVLVPFAVAARLTSDPLHVKGGSRESYWLERQDPEPSIEQLRRLT